MMEETIANKGAESCGVVGWTDMQNSRLNRPSRVAGSKRIERTSTEVLSITYSLSIM
ncbi:hypothetical protein D3C80_2004560 [compost metagenome]